MHRTSEEESRVSELRDRALTPAEVDRVLELRRRDRSYRQIAEEMDVSRTTVMNYVHEYGPADDP